MKKGQYKECVTEEERRERRLCRVRKNSKLYYLKNKVKINKRIKQYHFDNIDERIKYINQYYQKNKNRIKERNHKHYLNNKQVYSDRVRKYKETGDYKNTHKSWKEKNKNKMKVYYRKYDLKRGVGITLEEYNVMFDKQNGCCAGCNRHQSELKKSLSVDHCHTTGKIRGLLCYNCNLALGNVFDKISTLNNLIKYLDLNCQSLPMIAAI